MNRIGNYVMDYLRLYSNLNEMIKVSKEMEYYENHLNHFYLNVPKKKFKNKRKRR